MGDAACSWSADSQPASLPGVCVINHPVHCKCSSLLCCFRHCVCARCFSLSKAVCFLRQNPDRLAEHGCWTMCCCVCYKRHWMVAPILRRQHQALARRLYLILSERENMGKRNVGIKQCKCLSTNKLPGVNRASIIAYLWSTSAVTFAVS